MQEVLLISNSKPEQKSLDFEFLRQQGIENIQSLASKVWTDYNAHDPGITILEQLIYAITELGYKTNFDIKDIIAQNPSDSTKIKTGLFTAPEILSNTPVHIEDFRKVLIDTEGIRNAFLKAAGRTEIPVFIDTINKIASYTGDEPVNIRGLYSVILELDKDEEFGDLNNNVLDWSFVTTQGSAVTVNTEVSFPDWMAVAQVMREQVYPMGSTSYPRITSISLKDDELALIERRTYGAVLVVNIIIDDEAEESSVREIELPITIIVTDNIAKFNSYQFEADLKAALNNDPIDPPSTIEALILKYNRKLVKIWDIVYVAQEKLNVYRNLCEDFVELNSLKVEEVGLCLQIEVGPGADIEMIEAEIYFRVANFLSPKIKFHTATELINKGMTVDEVFEGPVLDHGFLDLKEAVTIDERKVLYVSDLIQIIMDIPGVISVADIHLSSYVDNVMMNQEVKDCLAPTFDESHRLRLSVQKSSTIFFRDDDPTDPQKVFLVASKRKVKEKIRELEILENSLLIGHNNNEFDAPEGTYRPLEEYHSVQYDFPVTYGIGEAGLSSSVTDLRNAQAKQLKSYLLFSEQLLANLLAQLSHIKELFAIDPTLKKTYFSQRINIPNAFPTAPEDNSYSPYANDADFDYYLQDIIEGKPLYAERRNKVLDHLLARFSEDFTLYSLKMFEVYGIGTEEKIIKDKLNFLNFLPVVSGERFRSYNYKDLGNTWNTDNVPGYQKRASLKLGIENFKRKSIAFAFEEREEDVAKVFRLFEKVEGNNPVSPTNAVSEDAGSGTVAWINEAGITQEGESSAPNEVRTGLLNENQTSEYLYVTGFGTSFSFIPASATITGIKVEIVKRIDPETGINIEGDIEDFEIKLLRGGVIVGANRAQAGTPWPSERRYFSYGGELDLWGTTWTDAEVKEEDFGVAIRVKKTGERQRRANVDHVKMTVFYNGGDVTYHFETQPESRSFGVSSIAEGYSTAEERAEVITEVVEYGYNFCNYCKDLATYRIKKALTAEDREGMCEAQEFPILSFNSGTNTIVIENTDLRTDLTVGKKVILIDNVDEEFEHTVSSILFTSGNSEITLAETVTTSEDLITLQYDRIDTVNVVYTGTNTDSSRAAADFSDLIFSVFWDFEGMHVIEHILLRPKVNEKSFVALPANRINETDIGKVRYALRKLISNINLSTNVLSISGNNLTGILVVGSNFKTFDEYENATVYTVQAISWNGTHTLITTQEDLEDDLQVVSIEYTRSFQISDFVNATNSIKINGVNLNTEIESILLEEEEFVFEIYSSHYNNGIYRIMDAANVEDDGANTRIYIQEIQKDYSDDLLPIVISEDDCTCPELRDNYSFRISVVMPEWPVRFKNGNFRKLAERILRYEAPAHVYVRLVWVDKIQMKEFETKYKAWLQQTSEVVPDPAPENEDASKAYRIALNQTHDEFVSKLFALKNKFSGSIISDISADSGSTGELSLLGQIYLG